MSEICRCLFMLWRNRGRLQNFPVRTNRLRHLISCFSVRHLVTQRSRGGRALSRRLGRVVSDPIKETGDSPKISLEFRGG